MRRPSGGFYFQHAEIGPTVRLHSRSTRRRLPAFTQNRHHPPNTPPGTPAVGSVLAPALPQPGPDSAAHAPAWPAPPASRGTAPPNVRPRRRGLHLGPRRRRPPTGVTPDSLARYHPLRLPVTGLPPRIIIATTLSTPILLPPLHPLFGGLRTGRRPFLPLTATAYRWRVGERERKRRWSNKERAVTKVTATHAPHTEARHVPPPLTATGPHPRAHTASTRHLRTRH